MTHPNAWPDEGEQLRNQLGRILGIELTPGLAAQLYKNALGPVRSLLYDVMVFYGTEADKCRSVQAYYSACLNLASSIESILALLCLDSEDAVSRTKVFETLKGESFEDKVLNARFEKYIQLASTLGWVPSDAVSAEVLQAALRDLPLVLQNLFPRLTESEKKARVESFAKAPGIEMLRFLQHLRNLIHANRWPRLDLAYDAHIFEADCKFVFVIAFEVMNCLFAGYARKALSQGAVIEEQFQALSAEERRLLTETAVALINPK